MTQPDEKNKIDFKVLIQLDEPHDTYSYLQGFKRACREFGIWRDGEQFLGCGEWTVREIVKHIIKFLNDPNT